MTLFHQGRHGAIESINWDYKTHPGHRIIIKRHFTEYMLNQHTQGQLLQYMRKKVLNVNQTKYATMTGISRKTLSDIELDKGKPVQSIVNKAFKPFGLKAGVVPIHLHVVQELIKQNDPEEQ